MKLFTKLYNKNSKVHKNAVDVQLFIFKTFMEYYNKTESTSGYFTDASAEKKAELHEMLGDYMLETLMDIHKSGEEDLVKAINRIFKEELDEARKSYKSRTKHWTDDPPKHNEELMKKIHEQVKTES